MAQHPNSCEICHQIAQIKRGEHPRFVTELPSGYVVMGESQFFRGYCLLLCKETAPDLEDLTPEFLSRFLADMARVSAAVVRVVAPHKMNIESLGNVVPHLHWHFFPRQGSETNPTQPVWLTMPQGDAATPYAFDAARDADLLEALRRELRA